MRHFQLPQDAGQGVPPHEKPQQRADQRGVEGVAHVVAANLAAMEAKRLQSAHLQTLVFHHAGDGGQHDHGRHGKGHQREQIAQVVEHGHVRLHGGGAALGVPVDDQRSRVSVADSRFHRVAAAAVFQDDRGLIQRHRGQRLGGQQHKAVVQRIVGGILVVAQVFGALAGAANPEIIVARSGFQGQLIAQPEPVGPGKAVVQKTAPQIAGFQRFAADHPGNVDAHDAVVGLQLQHGLVGQVGLHLCGKAGLHILHVGKIAQGLQRFPIHVHVDPQVCHVALVKIGVGRQVNGTPQRVQTAEAPGAQCTEQNDRHKLHPAFPHVPAQLAAKNVFLYHEMSSTAAG